MIYRYLLFAVRLMQNRKRKISQPAYICCRCKTLLVSNPRVFWNPLLHLYNVNSIEKVEGSILRVLSLRVLPASVWVPARHSSFTLQSKDVHTRLQTVCWCHWGCCWFEFALPGEKLATGSCNPPSPQDSCEEPRCSLCSDEPRTESCMCKA